MNPYVVVLHVLEYIINMIKRYKKDKFLFDILFDISSVGNWTYWIGLFGPVQAVQFNKSSPIN